MMHAVFANASSIQKANRLLENPFAVTLASECMEEKKGNPTVH